MHGTVHILGENACDFFTENCQAVQTPMNMAIYNLGKTESIVGPSPIVFGTKRKSNVYSELKNECNYIVVQSEKKVKYLGATIDQDMPGKLCNSQS